MGDGEEGMWQSMGGKGRGRKGDRGRERRMKEGEMDLRGSKRVGLGGVIG